MTLSQDSLDSKVHGANLGPISGWQDPDGPHVSPMNLAIWVLANGSTAFIGRSAVIDWDDSGISSLLFYVIIIK